VPEGYNPRTPKASRQIPLFTWNCSQALLEPNSSSRCRTPITGERAIKMTTTVTTTNRPDEWKIEQGLSGAVLPVLDMTKRKTERLAIQTFGPLTKDEKAIKSVGNRNKLFAAERKGWTG